MPNSIKIGNLTLKNNWWGGRISLQLIALLVSVFLVFLASLTVAGYMLHRHAAELRNLFSVDFERAILADKLARDAEALNAQVFERMLSHQKSTVNGNTALKNQMLIFSDTRDKLGTTDPGARKALEQIDRLQHDYFLSILSLDESIDIEDERQRDRDERLDKIIAIMRELDDLSANNSTRQYLEVDSLLRATLAFLSTTEAVAAPGQLRRLEAATTQRLDELRRIEGSDSRSNIPPALPGLINDVEILSRDLFARRSEALGGGRATLAMARETQVIGQKLVAGAVNRYLALSDEVRLEMARQADAVSRTVILVIIFSAVSALASSLACVYIVRRVGWRLRDLNLVMRAHVSGERLDIPQHGDDEIAEMGRAFGVFVAARDAAERELRQNQALLAEAAITDSLSGLPNRRGFDEALSLEWRRCARNAVPIAVVIADIDFFKAYNDQNGHLAGDECIRRIGELMAKSFSRSGDYPARYGGEEFVCILPSTGLDGAAAAAERFRQAVIATDIKHATSNVAPHITVSLGVASLIPVATDDPNSIIGIADAALYRAKQHGRDQVVLGGTETS